ncbi:MAG: hypothetical protein RIS51_19, partial [Actinomycetota bacterium]
MRTRSTELKLMVGLLVALLTVSGIGLPAQAAVPGSISISSLTAGNSYIEVAYSGGSGSTSIGYQISTDNFALDPDPTPIVVSDADKASPFTIGNLSNGVRYFVRVVAINSEGRTSSGTSDITVGPKTSFVGSGSSRNAFLQGQFAEVGIRANGAFGSNQTPPTGMHPNEGTCLGFRVDRSKDGWRATTTDDGDFFCPGSPYEGWFLKVGSSIAHNNDGNPASPAIAGTFSDLNTAEGEQSVKWESTSAFNGVSVSQVARVPDNSQILNIDITLTNVSGSTINNIYYGRAFDPDNTTGPGTFTTTNVVISRENPAVVQSTWSNESQISIRSSDPAARAAKLTGGLSGSDPQHIYDAPTSGSANGWTSNGSPTVQDAGTGVAVKIDLAAGASRTFRISYVLSNAESNIPTAPSINSITPSDGQLSVDFSPSYNSPTNYEYSLDDGLTWASRSPAATVSPLVLTGLTNGTNYKVKLRGTNSFGTSPPSIAVTGTPATLPEPPRLDYIAAGAGSLTVGFTPGANGGSAITNYQYSLSTDGASFSDFVSFSPAITSSPVVLSGLPSGTQYWVKVKAINAVGVSSESDVISGTTAGAPDAPSISSVIAANKSLTVNFELGDDGGLAISTLEWSVDDGATWYSSSPSVLTSPLVISDLINGATYPVRLRTVNSSGTSSASEPVSGTPKSVPDAPSYSGTVTANAGQISITIIPGAANGSPITNYQYSTDRGATWLNRTDSGGTNTALTITVESANGTTALTNKEYCVQIRAVNEVGAGAASNDSCFVPKTVPGTPTISSVVTGNATATLNILLGSNGGSSIKAIEYRLNGGSWVSASAS